MSAGWALAAHGTRGFSLTVGKTSWWAPTLALSTVALLTGVPALRRTLFGRRSWKRAKSQAESAPQRPRTETRAAASPTWTQELVKGATSAYPAAWDSATKEIVARHKERTGAELLSDQSSLERRNSGPLAVTRDALDQCLTSIPAVQPGTGMNEAPLSAKQWRQLLSLEAQANASGSAALTLTDRAELVARAASHSMAAGHALSWHWLSGLDEAIETLGTAEQKNALLPLLSHGHEIVAAGWTGQSRSPSKAVVVVEDHGGQQVMGLRVTCDLVDIVGADAATVIAIMVPTFDPNGHLQPNLQAEESAGMTCLLVRPSNSVSALKGAAMDERLASHSLTGMLHSSEAFVPLDHVLGGAEGVGAADDLAERCAVTWEAVRITSLCSGLAQRAAAREASMAVIRNVMCAETIEAWEHASLGALTSRLNALERVAALIAEERSITPCESRALRSAAKRGGMELIQRAFDWNEDAPPKSAEEAFVRNLPDPTDTAFEAALKGSWSRDPAWMPSWSQAAEAAVGADSPAGFDLARSEGWRVLLHAAARATLKTLPGLGIFRRMRPSGELPEAEVQLRQGRADLLRAYAAVRTAAFLMPPQSTSLGAIHGKLEQAEEQLTIMAFLELAHRVEGSQPIEAGILRLNELTHLAEAYAAVSSATNALQGPVVKAACRATLRPAHSIASGPAPDLAESVAASLVADPELLRRLLVQSYAGHSENFGTAPLRHAALMASASRVPIAAVQRAQSVGQLPSDEFSTVLEVAVERRIISSVDCQKIRACMAVSQEVLSGSSPSPAQQAARHTA